jgi:tryptophan-rich sensory protein
VGGNDREPTPDKLASSKDRYARNLWWSDMALETVTNLLAEMIQGVRVIGNTIRTTSTVVRILLVVACLSWVLIGVGLVSIGATTLFLPLLIWVLFTVLLLSFIGDVFGG